MGGFPYGFTAGIAVMIFSSQIKDLFGLHPTGAEPVAVLPKVEALWAARTTFGLPSALVALATILMITGIKRATPRLLDKAGLTPPLARYADRLNDLDAA